jgi:hypothetical protein
MAIDDCSDVVIGHSGRSGSLEENARGAPRIVDHAGNGVAPRDAHTSELSRPSVSFSDVTKGALTGCTVAGSIEMADNRGTRAAALPACNRTS